MDKDNLTVSDSDLDAASTNDIVDKKPADNSAADGDEKKNDSAEDNSERSRLGRKVAHLYDTVETLTAQLDMMLSKQGGSSQANIEPDIDDDTPLTKKEVMNLLSKSKQAEVESSKKYQSEYVKTVFELTKELDDETADKVINEMEKNYRSKYSDNAPFDAERNFYRAYTSTLKGSKPSNPRQGNPPNLPSGISGNDKGKVREVEIPDLDETAKDFIRRSGMTDEQIKEALTKPTPLYLRK